MTQAAVTQKHDRRGGTSVIPVLAGTLMIVAGGFVHGQLTDRWAPTDRSDVVGRLDQIPDQIADWVLIEEGTVSEDEQQMAELSGYALRHYRNQHSGDVVTMLLMCGPPGPVAVHPPTACYTGRGYEQSGDAIPHDVEVVHGESIRHSFMTAKFHRPGSHSALKPCIYWGWSTDGFWSVPANPRVAFAGSPVLFKLYITCESTGLLVGTDEFPPAQFLQELIPTLQASVFDQASEPATIASASETHSE